MAKSKKESLDHVWTQEEIEGWRQEAIELSGHHEGDVVVLDWHGYDEEYEVMDVTTYVPHWVKGPNGENLEPEGQVELRLLSMDEEEREKLRAIGTSGAVYLGPDSNPGLGRWTRSGLVKRVVSRATAEKSALVRDYMETLRANSVRPDWRKGV